MELTANSQMHIIYRTTLIEINLVAQSLFFRYSFLYGVRLSSCLLHFMQSLQCSMCMFNTILKMLLCGVVLNGVPWYSTGRESYQRRYCNWSILLCQLCFQSKDCERKRKIKLEVHVFLVVSGINGREIMFSSNNGKVVFFFLLPHCNTQSRVSFVVDVNGQQCFYESFESLLFG